jgi:hypothetical protein
VSFDPKQFRKVVDAVIYGFDPSLATPGAVNLVLGTCAQESKFGTYLRQLGGGPALGVFQMEPATFDWLRETYRVKWPELSDRRALELVWDLRLAVIMCRLRYLPDSEPIPPADDLRGLATYYKRIYNTPLGAATPEQFVDNYKRYVGVAG